MTKANDLASLLDANGDVVSSALDNVPAADLVNDTTPQLGGNLDAQSNDITSVGSLGVGIASPSTPLDVVSNSGANAIKIRGRAGGDDYGFLTFHSNDGTTRWAEIGGTSGGSLYFTTGTSGLERLRIDASGNAFMKTANSYIAGTTSLGFYGDAASSNGMFLDSSGNVGIGTSSPPVGLSVQGSTGDKATVQIKQTATGGRDYRLTSRDDGTFRINDDTAGAMRMQIDSSGRVTMPAQPRFSAYYAGNNNNTNNIASGGGEIPLNATRFNNGGHFSTSTSRFTAPIAGVYQFNTCFFGYINSGQIGAGNSIYLVLRVNGSNTVYITYQYYANTSSYPPLAGSVLVYLNASDYVTLYTNTGVYSDASNAYTHFSGHLIG